MNSVVLRGNIAPPPPNPFPHISPPSDVTECHRWKLTCQSRYLNSNLTPGRTPLVIYSRSVGEDWRKGAWRSRTSIDIFFFFSSVITAFLPNPHCEWWGNRKPSGYKVNELSFGGDMRRGEARRGEVNQTYLRKVIKRRRTSKGDEMNCGSD